MKKFICKKCGKLIAVQNEDKIEEGYCDKCFIKILKQKIYNLEGDLEAYKKTYRINISNLKNKIIELNKKNELLNQKIFNLKQKNEKLLSK